MRLGTLVCFGAVGASGAVVNTAAFSLLATALPSPVAAACAFELALLSNFTLHQRWTFAGRSAGVTAAFGRYQTAALGGLCLQILCLAVLSTLGLPPVFANAAGIACAMALNFLTSTRWTWRATHEKGGATMAPPFASALGSVA